MVTSGSYIVLTQRIAPAAEVDQFVAICEELGLASAGLTFDLAHESLDEAISLVLRRLAELGEVEGYLARKGLRIYRPDEDSPQKVVWPRQGEWVIASQVPIPIPATV